MFHVCTLFGKKMKEISLLTYTFSWLLLEGVFGPYNLLPVKYPVEKNQQVKIYLKLLFREIFGILTFRLKGKGKRKDWKGRWLFALCIKKLKGTIHFYFDYSKKSVDSISNNQLLCMQKVKFCIFTVCNLEDCRGFC